MGLLRFVLAALSLLLGAGAAAGAIAAQGGRFSAKLDVLTHFATLYLAAAVLALLLALPLRSGAGKALLLGLAFAGLAGSAALIAPEYLRRTAEPVRDATTKATLKLVQFNALGGERDMDASWDWLMAQKADVYVLQEAGALRDRFRRAGWHVSCRSCGAMVVTRAKPLRTYPARGFATDLSFVTASTLKDGRGEYTVVGVHRHWPTRFAKNAAQTGELFDLLARYPRDRLILAGDFNSTPWSFARKQEDTGFGLIRRTRAVFSWPAAKVSHNRLPAPLPYLPIDHVYAGPGWATVKVERGPRLGSDHYPVVVTLAPAAT
jgi:endonuclease/exonuclease/phosphatase (EEP) superfamily protein YafD